ncbi:MAG: hypothetical protein KAR47_09380 [Planctomycetes bacterium]|nr:hypothetical protein [Planctomycetota bacterium]
MYMQKLGTQKKYLLILLFLVVTATVVVTTTFIAKEAVTKDLLLIAPTILSPSPSGEKLAFEMWERTDSTFTARIQIMNMDGSNLQQITETPGFLNGPLAWSSDSKKIAFGVVNNETKTMHIHTVDVQSFEDKEVTTSDHKDSTAKWLPDGNKICFVRMMKNIHSTRKNDLPKELFVLSNLWLANIDSNQEEQLTTINEVYPLSWDWGQEGKRVFFLVRRGNLTEVWSVDIQTRKEEKLYSLKGWEKGARFLSCSPNGGNLLFFWQSSDLVEGNLWLLKADGSDEKELSSKRCALMPTWITDNRILTIDEKGGMWDFDIERDQYKRLGSEVTSRPPVWGTKTNKVFFVKGRTIWAMEADGSNQRRIYPEILSP